MINNNCDGSSSNRCLPLGEVRVLPSGGDSNLILCFNCYRHEISYRNARNKELSKDCQFKLPKWEDLKIYGED